MLMSLKLLSKPSHLSCYYFSVMCNFCLIFNLSAAEVKSESLQIHGFVAQGIIDADKSNYINDDESLSLELTEVGINASYQINNDFRIAG